MNDLIAFLNARLDEDEAAARAAAEHPWTRFGAQTAAQVDHIARHDPARVLREVEARRAIIRRCAVRMNEMDVHPNGLVSPRAVLARQALIDLAVIWNDHPDFPA